MDRSLKWRTIGLLASIVMCLAVLAPTFIPDKLPSWFFFEKKINLGLDLQGGLHIVYSIDLDRAVEDRAHEIKRDLDSRFLDEKTKATIKTPKEPVGGVNVLLEDEAKVAPTRAAIEADYQGTITMLTCPPEEGKSTPDPKAICFRVASSFADGIKKSALSHAVTTIRDRIDEKGIAEPTVVEKGDEILVELPGLDKSRIQETRELIARAAKLEFKVVDNGSRFMNELLTHVGSDDEGKQSDPVAIVEGVFADVETWKPEDSGDVQSDSFLFAHNREAVVSVEEAKVIGGDCVKPEVLEKAVDGVVTCEVPGRHVLAKYLAALEAKDPKFKVPDDRQISFEENEPSPEAKDKRKYWRTYYLDRAVRLTGSSISDAMGSYDQNTNRPIVLLDFNRYGSRVFGDLTAEIVGKKLATILDDKVKSAPIINGAIRGGRASITMGGNDATRQEQERDELVNVLKTGSLPAPLKEESASEVGPTLGMDAIAKTRLSFGLGILLVVIIMVGVYKWSGWIAVFAVAFHVLVTIAVMALFGATLTLPGIAALVLSVGMCVDGNILINERIRDELLLGKSVRGAVDVGFSRAFSAILDGQFTIAASAWVLLQYGSGPIKGFAVMMLVGVFTTVATNTWVTRILFDWNVARKKHATTLSI